MYEAYGILFLPFTTKKADGEVPILKPVDCNFLKCCASYLEDDFEDWNEKVETMFKYLT